MKSLHIFPALLLAAFLDGDARAAGVLTTLHSFTGEDGAHPVGGLRGKDGNFYGTTEYGGNLRTGTNDEGKGTIFKMLPDGTVTTLHSFAADEQDGGWPVAGMVEGPNGTFYGMTTGGGLADWGTVFTVAPGGHYTSLRPFAAGAANSLLIPGRDGNFYSTALFGGEYDLGTLFRVTPEGSVSVLFSFDGTNGFDPDTLVPASDGNFYGTTAWGGPRYATGGAGYGTFFKLTPDGNHTFLYWFHNTNGVWPTALVDGGDGNFYGTTGYGGVQFLGTFFRITPGGEHTMLASFTGTNGFEPGSLMRASDGNFYGTTRAGTGNAKNGTIFKATPDGVLTTLSLFNGTNGASPRSAPLIQTAEATFYGITYMGGASNLGTIFRLQITPDLPPPSRLDFQLLNNQLVLSWTNTGLALQSAPAVIGTFTNLPAATSPYTSPLTTPQQFFRLIGN